MIETTSGDSGRPQASAIAIVAATGMTVVQDQIGVRAVKLLEGYIVGHTEAYESAFSLLTDPRRGVDRCSSADRERAARGRAAKRRARKLGEPDHVRRRQ